MSQHEELRVQLKDTLTLQHKIRLFAMTNLSEGNPFKPVIEAQTCKSVNEIRDTLEALGETEGVF